MQKRIILSTLLSVAVVLITLGVISRYSVNDTINRSLENRLKLASIISNYINALIQSNLTRLYDISLSGAVDLRDGNWEPEKKALKAAYQYSIFTDGIFLLDLKGGVMLAYPPGRHADNLSGILCVNKALRDKKAVVSDVHVMERTGMNVIFVLVPLKDKDGRVIGLAGGEINPTSYFLSSIIKAIPASAETSIELVDSKGMVIASNSPGKVFTCSDHNEFLGNLIALKKTAVTTCHRCHTNGGGEDVRKTTDMLAFSPLADATWGVAVREPMVAVFAPSARLEKTFLLLGFISMGSALVLSIGITNSIVKPIKSLTAASARIALGNLKDPVNVVSRDEIGKLAESFDVMRMRLLDSLESIQRYNIELERRVDERTSELKQNKTRLAKLLKKVIMAQEDERKRVARELHDETSQSLAALGMSIDIAAMAHKASTLRRENFGELKAKVDNVLDGIKLIIRDLRPSILDDLGFETGVRWLLEHHLAERGVERYLVVSDGFRAAMETQGRTNPTTELALFRVVQEAVINTAKHSGASNVFVFLEARGDALRVGIEDDGSGFEVQEIMKAADRGEAAGFGILGMKERIELLGGKFSLCSRVGEGTFVSVDVPMNSFYEVDNV